MATKLKNLKVTSVDFVDEGANPAADIKIFKRKDTSENSAASEETVEGQNNSLVDAITKALSKIFGPKGEEQEEEQEVEKRNVGFEENLAIRKTEQVINDIYEVMYAFCDSLMSIINDPETTDKHSAMAAEYQDFATVMPGFIEKWSNLQTAIAKSNHELTEKDLPTLEFINHKSSKAIEKITKAKEGDEEMAKVDITLMTPSERAFYEDIVKRCSTDTKKEKNNVSPQDSEEEMDPEAGGEEEEEEDEEKKKKTQKTQKSKEAVETDDVYKGLHPAIKAELESLKKFKEDAEMRELTAIAKKYESIGKKAEELAPVLKSMRDAGQLDNYLAVLDESLSLQENSGIFGEIGKSHEGFGDDNAESIAKLNTAVSEIRKAHPELTEAQARDKAFLAHPELIKVFE